MRGQLRRIVLCTWFPSETMVYKERLHVAYGLGHLADGDFVVLRMFQKRLSRWTERGLGLYADVSGVAAGNIDDMISVRRGLTR